MQKMIKLIILLSLYRNLIIDEKSQNILIESHLIRMQSICKVTKNNEIFCSSDYVDVKS